MGAAWTAQLERRAQPHGLMAEGLDGGVVLCHVTGEPPEMAARVSRALPEAAPRSLALTDVTVAEILYVLRGPYAQPRDTIAGLDVARRGP